MLRMDMEYKHKILFIRLNGDLKRKNCYKINNYLNPVLAKHKIKVLIVNLAKLKSIDESGINAMLRLKCTMRKNSGIILICHVPSNLSEVLKSLKLKVVPNEKSALNLI